MQIYPQLPIDMSHFLFISVDYLEKKKEVYSFVSDSLPKIKKKKMCVFRGPAIEWKFWEVNLFYLTLLAVI